MTTNVTTFEWDATESAPEHYPMEIIQGEFLFIMERMKEVYTG
jgi:hypothetical protein